MADEIATEVAEAPPAASEAAPVPPPTPTTESAPVPTPTTVTLPSELLERYLCLSAQLIDLEQLVYDPVNAREHPEPNIKAIISSLKKFGQDQPLVVQRKGNIVRKGNGRLEAMRKLKWKQAVVVFVDDDDITAVERALADNRTAELAKWNEAGLASLMKGLTEEGRDVTELGWTKDQMEKVISAAESQDGSGGPAPSDEVPTNYQILITCKDEKQHTEALEKLSEMGYDIRSLIS